MNTASFFLLTAHSEFAQIALTELQQIDAHVKSIRELAPGILFCETSNLTSLVTEVMRKGPIFVRHLAPVQTVISLTATEQDVGRIATALVELPTIALLERGTRFAVQSRLLQTEPLHVKRPYSSGMLNQTLAEALAEETEAVEAIKKPQIVVSVLCTAEQAYLGISPVEENLSNWPGGARHFAHVPEEISRAEFKLLEALEVFSISLPTRGRILDLGAAPGGWTRLMLEKEMEIVAVDPANLDPRLQRQKRLSHYRGYAEDYLAEAVKKHSQFDIILNDMRMDAREAARLLGQAASCLQKDGVVISVFKLPHATRTVDPRINLNEALRIMKKHYAIVQARQLFHNRQEVTVVAAQALHS